MQCGNLNFLEPSGPFQACNGTVLPLLPEYEATVLVCRQENSNFTLTQYFTDVRLPLHRNIDTRIIINFQNFLYKVSIHYFSNHFEPSSSYIYQLS